MVEYPTELVDDNKVRAAVQGTDGRLIDFRRGQRIPARQMGHDLVVLLAEHADQLGCRAELEGVDDLITNGTGAHRQIAIHERTGDLKGLVAEIVEKSRP
jgi:carboxylate-amine ligase